MFHGTKERSLKQSPVAAPRILPIPGDSTPDFNTRDKPHNMIVGTRVIEQLAHTRSACTFQALDLEVRACAENPVDCPQNGKNDSDNDTYSQHCKTCSAYLQKVAAGLRNLS